LPEFIGQPTGLSRYVFFPGGFPKRQRSIYVDSAHILSDAYARTS
jgi:hypothetical protein